MKDIISIGGYIKEISKYDSILLSNETTLACLLFKSYVFLINTNTSPSLKFSVFSTAKYNAINGALVIS
ncbi:hypothetical protein G6Y95_07215, partial [Clostridium perfringens]|nr:hypothetical protein [Clostridium perfringens]